MIVAHWPVKSKSIDINDFVVSISTFLIALVGKGAIIVFTS